MAWDVDRLERAQEWFCRSVDNALNRFASNSPKHDDLLDLAQQEINAFLAVMSKDPLLPQRLWPPDYLGPKTVDAHRRFLNEIADRL